MSFFSNITIYERLVFLFPILRIKPISFVGDATVVSLVVTSCLLMFTFFYLIKRRRFSSKSRQAKKAFEGFLSEIILSESEEELYAALQPDDVQRIIQKWLVKPFGRKILIGELIKVHRSMSGKAAENIIWLYNHFELDADSIKNFNSRSWHKKALAIQELAEMKQQQYLKEICKETNHSNKLIRTEAQTALVKLTGFGGLKFLNTVSHPITQWQQFCLLQYLSSDNHFSSNQLPGWLQSKNDTVVEFSLRLAENYKSYEVHDEVALCLQHSSSSIRRQALHTLKEICQEQTVKLLEEYFITAAKEEQLYILEVFSHIGSANQIPFLVCLLRQEDEAIKYAAVKLVQQWRSDWYEIVSQHVNDKQSSLQCVIAELIKEEAA